MSHAVLLLLPLVAAAAVTDLYAHRIPDGLTYPGIVMGVLLNAWQGGWPGCEDALGGLLACGGIMMVSLLFFDIGGGDVKLLAMMGACLGLYPGLDALLWTMVLGAALAMIGIVWRVGTWSLLYRAGRHLLASLRLGQWLPLTDAEREHLKAPLYLAPAACAAVLLVVFRVV